MTGRHGVLASRGPGELTVQIAVDVPAEEAFAVVTDWVRQSEWIALTKVRVAAGDGRSAGSELAAFTGVGRLGFVDMMEIVRWDPPHSVDVVHYGAVVRGPGSIRVEKLSGARALILWQEWLHLPLGRLGLLAWPVVRAGAAAGFQRSLRLLKRSMEGQP